VGRLLCSANVDEKKVMKKQRRKKKRVEGKSAPLYP
jgi:hypothetical protein